MGSKFKRVYAVGTEHMWRNIAAMFLLGQLGPKILQGSTSKKFLDNDSDFM